MLQKQFVELYGKSVSRDSFVVDLSETEIHDDKTVQSILPVAYGDTVYSLEACNRTYFLQRNDSVILTRNENNLEYIDYDMPEVRLKFPIRKGDLFSGYFHGLGMYCDKLAMRKFGSYTTVAETSGRVVLPDGGILHDCLCLHTVRNVSYITYSSDSLHAALPIFTSDSIISRCALSPSPLREEAYLIYAPGYRYPIIEICDVYDVNSLLSHAAYYTSPDVQALLYDSENYKKRVAMAGSVSGNIADGGRYEDSGIPRYHVLQNSGGQTLSITMDNSSAVTVTADLVICDIRGVVYRKQRLICNSGERRTAELSYSGLRHGEYALRIFSNDGNDYSEKFVVR